jgi:hypothetical protein
LDSLSIIQNSIGKMAGSNAGWKVLKPFVKAGNFLQWKRKEAEEKKIHQLEADLHAEAIRVFNALFSDRTVLHGPFKGLRYPELDAVGSGLYPKLIGSYERELSAVFEMACRQPYTEIIDIGCAEGYYAVGCSMRIPTAKVFAYDTNEKARTLCSEMAKLNGVDQRVVIRSLCSAEELRNFHFTGKGLVICDCEGYEYELFDETNFANLANCDLVIEAHDFINPEISTRLRSLFSDTHEITIIKSTTDDEKTTIYDYEETNNMETLMKKLLFKEGRPDIMEWLFLASKK